MNNKLYVGNLPYSTTEDDLRQMFSEAGNIRSITIPIDKMSNRPRGFAFVEMETGEEASKAINLFNGQDMQGRTLNVSEARPPENRGGGGGSGGYSSGGGGGGGGGNRDRGYSSGGGKGGGKSDRGGSRDRRDRNDYGGNRW
jgi:RNA recognition motif-containing protein